jgi:hypothetical protein
MSIAMAIIGGFLLVVVVDWVRSRRSDSSTRYEPQPRAADRPGSL